MLMRVFFFVGFVFFQIKAQAQLVIPPTEGFSLGRIGLPDSASDAWEATVFINKTVRGCNETGQLRDARNWGAGVVIAFDSSSRIALIATNSHVINGCKSALT